VGSIDEEDYDKKKSTTNNKPTTLHKNPKKYSS
jgi:hypothetical protein